MEQVLIGCAVLVCLAGIMFESDHLAVEGRSGQRDAVLYVTIFIIVTSLFYYFAVFISELCPGGAFTVCIRIFAERRKDADVDNDPSTLDNNPVLEADLDNIVMAANPMVDPTKNKRMYATKEAKLAEQSRQAEEALETAEKQNSELRAEVARLRKIAMQGSDSATTFGRAVNAFTKKRTKKEFASTKSHDSDDTGAVDFAIGVGSSRSLPATGRGGSSLRGSSLRPAGSVKTKSVAKKTFASGSMAQKHDAL